MLRKFLKTFALPEMSIQTTRSASRVWMSDGKGKVSVV